MENTQSSSSTLNAVPATENKHGIKLVFRVGQQKDLISNYEGKIAILDRLLKELPVAGISYTCELKPMLKGNGWVVVDVKKTPTIKASFGFRLGKEIYNERTNTYKQDYISTYEPDGKIVIAPKEMIPDARKEYDCEIVLSPTGKAYIVEKAEVAAPAVAKIIAHEYPVSCVEIEIGGVLQVDLTFDCTNEDEKDLKWKISKLGARSIIDRDMIVSNYEATCLELMGKHKSMGYEKNSSRLR
jgi:hypothetical protein